MDYQPYQSTWRPAYLPTTNQGQPVMPQVPQQPVQGLVRVTGIEGARAYNMPPNSVMPLFDGNEPLFYVRTTDAGGFPTIKTYRFEEVVETPQAAQEQMMFATKDDIAALRNEIEQLRGGIANAQPTVPADKPEPAR